MSHASAEAGPRANWRTGKPTGKPAGKPTGVDININGHFQAKVYTTGDKISGNVVIKPTRDVAFDDFEILFTGLAATRIDFVNQYATYSTRPFMKLRMPIRDADLPGSRVFQAGRTYIIPFNFVVPSELTIGACTHACENTDVHHRHLRLPPTMGFWDDNDQSPDMAQIEYAIKAQTVRKTNTNGPQAAAPALEGHHMLKVLPAQEEDAPLDITDRDERYSLSKTKALRKNIFSGKMGKLTATASQPGAIVFSPDGYKAYDSSIRVRLDFAATSSDVNVPKINSVSTKLHATTYFGSAPMNHLPNLGARIKHDSNPTLTYSTTSQLGSTFLTSDSVSWEKLPEGGRRDSDSYSTPDDASASDSDAGRATKKSTKGKPAYHSAIVDIPLTLPLAKHKFFPPSFHSCLITRAYIVQLTINAGPMNTAINLNIPLQLAVESRHPQSPMGGPPTFEQATADADAEEADDYFQPRLMQVPSESYRNTSVLPSYNSVNRPPVAVV